MQICVGVEDLLGINFSRNLRYDTISTYDSTLIFYIFINYLSYQYFVGLVYIILAMILAL
jgi:hypothetical protein